MQLLKDLKVVGALPAQSLSADTNGDAIDLYDANSQGYDYITGILDVGALAGDAAVAAALTTALTGANNDIVYTAQDAGADGNDITVTYSDPGSDGQSLAVSVSGTDITVDLATDDGDSATADIGSGDNGVVTTTVTAAGSAGNSYTIEVVEGVGADVAMSAAIVGTAITVTLGTDGASALDATKNTAILIGAAVDALTGVSAAHSGTGADAITAAEGPTSFTGGGDNYSITSTADLIKTAIEGDVDAAALVAVADAAANDGSGVVTAMSEDNLADGSDALVITAAFYESDDSGFGTSTVMDGGAAVTLAETYRYQYHLKRAKRYMRIVIDFTDGASPTALMCANLLLTRMDISGVILSADSVDES